MRDQDGQILASVAVPLGKASNNVAEYTGLIEGLKLVRDIDASARVEARLDSKLVVEQMSGRWKIKHEDMKRLAAEAATILPPMQVTYTWIPGPRTLPLTRSATRRWTHRLRAPSGIRRRAP